MYPYPEVDQGGPPPELMDALMGGGPPMAGGDPFAGGAPQEAPAPEMSVIEHLRQAIEHAQAALVAEPDDIDSQKLTRAVGLLYDFLAGRQKEEESVMGNAATQRVLKRSYGP